MLMFHPLESRRLFAGGIDASFGSAEGAFFGAPGNVPTLNAQTVDPLGRVTLVGYTQGTQSGSRQMFIARLTADGVPDTSFGGLDTGVSVGTPRGIVQLAHVAAVPDGSGYYALGQLGTAGATTWRMVKFDSRGRIDASFGKNGVVSLDGFAASAIVVQADGRPIVVMHGVGKGDQLNVDDVYYAVRYSASGKMDRDYDDQDSDDLPSEPNGYAFLSYGNEPDEFTDETVNLNSVTLDPGGRLLVAFDRRSSFFSSETTYYQTYLRRLSGNGRADAKFTGGNLNVDPNVQNSTNQGSFMRRGAAVGRPDGQIAVLIHRESPDSIEVMLAGSRGQLSTRQSPPVNLSTLVPGFTRAGTFGDSIIATEDNKLVIAGTVANGHPRTPTLARLNADLSLDTTFGTGGTIAIPTTGSRSQADGLTMNADGTITAIARPDPIVTPRAGGVRIARVFVDDAPVVALRSVQRKSDVLRVTVSIRGINPVDPTTIDDGDLKLVDAAGGRTKLRFVSSDSPGNGDMIARYQATRPAGRYDILAISKQILDDHEFSNRGTVIGSIT